MSVDEGDRRADLEEAERILRAGCGRRLRTAFPLAPLTTFRIGGPAALYLEAEDEGDLTVAAEAIAAARVPWIVIGKGSNILVSDGGFPGLVLRLGKAYRWVARDGARLHAGGSMPLPALAGVALAHSLSGLEFGVAIPASVGGAVRMNAGAHRGSMDQVLERIELYSVVDANRSAVAAGQVGFRYRHSDLPEASIVIGATLHLRPGEPPDIRREMDEARAWRKATQPLAEPNCGSVFKNPPGDHAARLVEAVGAKGLTVGGAMVSEKHSNFIVARPGATAADVHRLVRMIQDRVAERFGVPLEPEVQFIGDFDLAPL
jgi:UDP-N-acetylmuramate dehydrogenase